MTPPAAISVSNDEFISARDFMRHAPTLLDRLETGAVEKLVVLQENQMRCVILTPERWAQLQHQAEQAGIELA